MTTVLQAITSQVSDARTRLAMTLGALLEGGTLGASGFGVGDNGNSHGPFQINAPYHPDISVSAAEDPTKAVAYMLPRYQSAVGKVPASLWQSDPEKAAEQAAYLAENPAQDYYVARGASTVNNAYAQAKAALAGQPITASGSGTGTAGGTATATDASLHWSDLYNPIQAFKDINPLSLFGGLANDAESAVVTFALEALFVLGGLALVVGGLYRASAPARDNVKQQVESAAPLAAAAV